MTGAGRATGDRDELRRAEGSKGVGMKLELGWPGGLLHRGPEGLQLECQPRVRHRDAIKSTPPSAGVEGTRS